MNDKQKEEIRKEMMYAMRRIKELEKQLHRILEYYTTVEIGRVVFPIIAEDIFKELDKQLEEDSPLRIFFGLQHKWKKKKMGAPRKIKDLKGPTGGQSP